MEYESQKNDLNIHVRFYESKTEISEEYCRRKSNANQTDIQVQKGTGTESSRNYLVSTLSVFLLLSAVFLFHSCLIIILTGDRSVSPSSRKTEKFDFQKNLLVTRKT